ncbi:putative agamous-like MADS-box protein AGL81 [Cocos nucifera]|uniref:Putative agamous-like MADS-box protein AGL81 n=1 Tax=Cocos nucifera TaxID=13894 RepID=A0A8K0N916_COCNU|nr:putative agamous-like MADS-box protein AGL81 [Cocos nucifera]
MAPPQGNGATTGGKGDGRSEKSRRRSIKYRMKGLCKKAYELATLCDVELALVSYSSDADEPTTWPPDRSKIKDAIHHYFETPGHKKLPKNQITLDNPNPVADEKKDPANPNPDADEKKAAAKAAASKAPEETDRLRIPFSDDEDKLIALRGILDSKLEAVRKMIKVRRTEGMRDPRPSARDPGKELPIAAANAGGGDPRPSAGDRGKKLALGQGGLPPPAAAVAAASANGGDPRTSDRDRGRRVAGYYGPVWGWGYPGFPAGLAPAGRGGGGAPNSWYPYPCRYCPVHGCCHVHGHVFTGRNGR